MLILQALGAALERTMGHMSVVLFWDMQVGKDLLDQIARADHGAEANKIRERFFLYQAVGGVVRLGMLAYLVMYLVDKISPATCTCK